MHPVLKHIIVFFVFFTISTANVFAQPPMQKFWALNQPHYIYMNGSTGWTLNNNGYVTPSISTRSLILTTNVGNQASSAFYNLKIGTRRDFTVTFTYTPSGDRAADGFTFLIQNNSITGLGNAGGSLGYYPTFTNSMAIGFNLYSSYTVGVEYFHNATVDPQSTTYTSVSSLGSGTAVNVTIVYSYSAKTLVLTLVQGATTIYNHTYTAIDIPTIVGSPVAWVGFTGATGGSQSTQTISNFIFK